MDFAQMTLAGLVAIGAVNVALMFKPDLDSRLKFGLALLVAFIVGFVPLDYQNLIMEKLVQAIEIALASSGGYKLFSKAGGA